MKALWNEGDIFPNVTLIEGLVELTCSKRPDNSKWVDKWWVTKQLFYLRHVFPLMCVNHGTNEQFNLIRLAVHTVDCAHSSIFEIMTRAVLWSTATDSLSCCFDNFPTLWLPTAVSKIAFTQGCHSAWPQWPAVKPMQCLKNNLYTMTGYC